MKQRNNIKKKKAGEEACAALNMEGANVWFVQHLTSFTLNENHTSHIQRDKPLQSYCDLRLPAF